MLGTAQFGLDYGISNTSGQTEYSEVRRILSMAYNGGIDWIDTAHTYGKSESILGRTAHWLNIVTKTSDFDIDGPDTLSDGFSESLRRLNRRHVYGLLVHREMDLIGPRGDDVFAELALLKRLGRVKKIGVSVYTPQHAMQIIDKYPIDIMQFPCSVLDQRFIHDGIVQKLADKNIEAHARSIFLQGLVFMDLDTLDKYFAPVKQTLQHLHNTADRMGVSVLKIAIEYVKSLDNIDRIIIGVNNAEQLNDIFQAYAYDDIEVLTPREPFKCDVDFKEFAILDERYANPANWRLNDAK
jgi:aryl-alcohol dehydrogenase-like predicted oxidoreductase